MNHKHASIFGSYTEWPGKQLRRARSRLGSGRATQMKMFFLGLMVAFTPSLLVLAWTLRRAPKNQLTPEAYTEPNKYLAPGDTQKA
jgi:hypothetical protein